MKNILRAIILAILSAIIFNVIKIGELSIVRIVDNILINNGISINMKIYTLLIIMATIWLEDIGKIAIIKIYKYNKISIIFPIIFAILENIGKISIIGIFYTLIYMVIGSILHITIWENIINKRTIKGIVIHYIWDLSIVLINLYITKNVSILSSISLIAIIIIYKVSNKSLS